MPAISSSYLTKISDRLGVQFDALQTVVRSNGKSGEKGTFYDIATRLSDPSDELTVGALLSPSEVVDSVFVTKTDFTRIIKDIGGTYTNVTRGIATVSIYPLTIASLTTVKFYCGYTGRFDDLQVWLESVNGLVDTVTVDYWNGAWTSLTITDGTSGAIQSGQISWTTPTDWVSNSLNTILGVSNADSTASLYYVRLTITNVVNNTALLLGPIRTFVPVYSNFTFNAATLISALLTQILANIDPVTNTNYVDLDAYLENNPVPARVSANFADLMFNSLSINLLARSVFPDQEYTFGSYNLASGLTQTGTYKLASASPNPTTVTVDSTYYSRGTPGVNNSVDFAGTNVKGVVTTVLNNTVDLRISGYDHTGALQTWSAGTAGWTISFGGGSLSVSSSVNGTAENGLGSRLLLITSVSKNGAGTTGVVSIRTSLDRTPTL